MQTTSQEVQLFKPDIFKPDIFKPDIFKDGEHGTINAVCTYPVNAEAEPTMLVDPQEQSLQDLWRQPEMNDGQMTELVRAVRENASYFPSHIREYDIPSTTQCPSIFADRFAGIRMEELPARREVQTGQTRELRRWKWNGPDEAFRSEHA
jgi:hypothetical protein